VWRGREGKKERTAGLTQGSATHHRRMMSCRPSSRHMVEAKVNLFPFFSKRYGSSACVTSHEQKCNLLKMNKKKNIF
jgi:hypothetical protein